MTNTATTQSLTFKMSASYVSQPRTEGDPSTPNTYDISTTVATPEEAQAIAATFPKGCKAKATTLSRPIDGSYLNGTERVGYIAFQGYLAPNGTTGAVNETAAKRYRQVVKAIANLGHTVEYRTPYGNSYPTQAAFEAALEA